MGFADDVAKRISAAFSRDKDQANIQLAKGATGELGGGDATAIDLMSGVGYDALTDYLRLDTDLLLRFADYEEMDDYGEIACLTGNSEIGVLGDGPYGVDYVTVTDLIAARAADPSKKFFTLAVDLEGCRVVPVEMRGPVLSGKQSPVFKVTFEEYRSQPNEPKRQWSVRATANHPFMLRDGTYRTVAQLTPGTRLMAAGFAKTAGGYAQVRDLFNTRSGKSQYDYLHRMVCREILNEGNAIGNDDVVHHLDENKLNNDPSNLQIVRRADHARDHAPTQTPAVRAKLSKVAKARWADPLEAARWSAGQRRTKAEDLAVSRSTNTTPKGALSEAHRQAIAAGRTLPLAKDIVETALRTSTSISAAARSLKISDSTLMRRVLHYGLSTQLIGTSLQSIHLGEEAYSNHVIVSVEPDGFDDVFDIEVPKYRNFLVAGGVFVHNTALDILADDATQPDSVLHRTIWITSPDKTLQSNLDDLFNRTLRMDEEIWEIARTLCKYGNDYEELLVNADGVRGINYLPPPTVRRLETPKGDLIGFMQDFKGRFDFTNNDFQRTLSAKFDLSVNTDPMNQPVAAFESWEVVHFRLRGKERRSVYGHSALEAARWIWKRLMLLEDAALVYRLQRAPERFAFYVDVGDLPPQEALAFVNRVRQNFRKKRFVDPGTGKLNLKFDALSQDEDFFVPTRKGVDSTRIETLGAPQWQAMDDIEYFRDKLFSAIKVPKAYLGQESGVARAVLSSEDVRFARTVLRIQRELKNGLRKVARVHLSALGLDPYAVDYDINMTVPSAIFELAQMEVRTAKADLAARMRDFVSLQWILSNVFGLSEDEIATIKKQRSGESAEDAENQAAAQNIIMPPPPPMEAPPGEAPPEEGPYGPPAEARQPNRVVKALSSSRDAARRRGIPTHSGFSDRELTEGYNPKDTKRMDAKLDTILKSDRGLELRLREIGGLLRDLNARGAR
jgi:hypothetical protein